MSEQHYNPGMFAANPQSNCGWECANPQSNCGWECPRCHVCYEPTVQRCNCLVAKTRSNIHARVTPSQADPVPVALGDTTTYADIVAASKAYKQQGPQ